MSSSVESELHKEIVSNLVNIKVLSHHTEALTTVVQLSLAHIHELKAWLEASDTHATIRNLKNQELCHQIVEKTGMCKKHKINMEGCIITSLNGVALFVQ